MLIQRGIDVEQALRWPLRRFVALVYAIVREQLSWAEEKVRKPVLDLLEWPDDVERAEMRANEQQAHKSLAAVGVSVDFAALARARARSAAERTAREAGMQAPDPATSNNDAVTPEVDE